MPHKHKPKIPKDGIPRVDSPEKASILYDPYSLNNQPIAPVHVDPAVPYLRWNVLPEEYDLDIGIDLNSTKLKPIQGPIVKKRDKNKIITFDEVFTEEHMLESYKHARTGKKKHRNQIIYHMNQLSLIRKLYDRLEDDTYKIEELSRFKVYEPKEREVIADLFEDKIVQDVISKYVLRPLLTPKVIYDNYASQPGKGTKLAVERLQRNMSIFAKSTNWTGDGWVLVCDISKFFYMIYQKVMWEMIDVLPIDDKLKRLLRDQIYTCDPDINPYTKEDGRGLCIGFQTSQWFAIYYLNPLDHFIKETLRIKCYGRYMDDFYLMHENKEYLEECLVKIKEFVQTKLKLTLNKKTHIHPFKQGVCFLGYHVTYNQNTHQVETKIRAKSINKMLNRTKKHLKFIRRGILEREKAAESLQSWHAYAMYGETKKSINSYAKAREMIAVRRNPENEYKDLIDDWTNIEPEGFFRLKPIPGHTAQDCLRDIDGFAILMKKKKSKREAWADGVRRRVLANPHLYAKRNLEALLGNPDKFRYKQKSKQAVAKESMNKTLLSLKI